MTSLLGLVAAIFFYLSTRSFLVAGVMLGTVFLVDLGTISAADTIQRGRRR